MERVNTHERVNLRPVAPIRSEKKKRLELGGMEKSASSQQGAKVKERSCAHRERGETGRNRDHTAANDGLKTACE